MRDLKKNSNKSFSSIQLFYPFKMKVLVFVSIFIGLSNITSGLKCYQCNDYVYHATHGKSQHVFGDYEGQSCDVINKTEECLPSEKFCLTYHDIDYESDDLVVTGLSFAKGCDREKLCESVESHVILHPITYEKVQAGCCQGDLCNGPEQQSKDINLPSSHNK